MSLTPVDAYALARHVARLKIPDGVQPSITTRLLISSYDTDDPEQQTTLITLLQREGLLDTILAVDKNAPPQPAPVHQDAPIHVPELLSYAQLDDRARNAGEQCAAWWHDAVSWASHRSPMTPVQFLELGMVWLLGLATARRVYVELHERIYAHTYLLLVAETSRYAKSTGMNTVYSLVAATMPHMLIPGHVTPEGMVDLLSGNRPNNYDSLGQNMQRLLDQGRKHAAQRGIIMDEYSSLLGNSKKDYMQGFLELLMRLYDAREYEQHYTRSGGMLTIQSPGISIFGATTPAAMARALPSENWENGAMARYLLIYRDQPLPYNPQYIRFVPPSDILDPLRRLHFDLPPLVDELYQRKPDYDGIEAVLSDTAMDRYQLYMRAVFHDMLTDELDERLHGNYRRMHIQALKMALALACIDWASNGSRGQIVIELGHWAIAQQLAEKSRYSLHRLMPVLSESRDARLQRDLVAVLRHAPAGGLTVRDICRQTGRPTKDIYSALDVLLDSGAITVLDHRPGTGRPTKLYSLVSSI